MCEVIMSACLSLFNRIGSSTPLILIWDKRRIEENECTTFQKCPQKVQTKTCKMTTTNNNMQEQSQNDYIQLRHDFYCKWLLMARIKQRIRAETFHCSTSWTCNLAFFFVFAVKVSHNISWIDVTGCCRDERLLSNCKWEKVNRWNMTTKQQHTRHPPLMKSPPEPIRNKHISSIWTPNGVSSFSQKPF